MARAPKAAKAAAEEKHSFVVTDWPIEKVKPYGNNPRTITDAAVEKVARSITEFGWRQPIVVDSEGFVIVGHTRLRAAALLGLKVVPVHVAEGLSAEKVRAYRLADNRTGEENDWDKDLLLTELGSFAELDDFDMQSLGFDADDLQQYLGDDYVVLDPETQRRDITAADVAKADKGLKDNPKKSSEQELVDLICPHCGKEYAVAKHAIA